MDEIWKPIKNYGNYCVSNKGNIKNIKTNKLLKFAVKNKYNYVNLTNDENNRNMRVHRIVAESFLVNNDINKIYVNHKNGNKFDNTVDNLEYITPSNNVIHAIDNKLLKPITKQICQYDKKNNLINIYPSIIEASKKTNIDNGSICKVCKSINKSAGGYIWTYIVKEKIDENLDEMVKIKNYHDYSVTRDGKIYSHKRNRFLATTKIDGYTRVHISDGKNRRGLLVHRIVAETYILNPNNKPFVNHINKNREDNNVKNLEWVTQSENMIHALNN